MKKSIITLLFSITILQLFAQSSGTAPLGKGEKQLNFGAGFSDHGLPVYISLDYAIHKDVTLTPEVNVRFDDDVSAGLLFKGDYHFNALIGIPQTWDFYAGARIGVDFGDGVDLNLGGQVGGRWYWSEKWGLNAEFSGGTGFGSVFGVSMKM